MSCPWYIMTKLVIIKSVEVRVISIPFPCVKVAIKLGKCSSNLTVIYCFSITVQKIVILYFWKEKKNIFMRSSIIHLFG